jgi:hypothetical protein
MAKTKHANSKSGYCAAAACCAILLLCLAVPAYCEQDGTALMLEITPSQGGYLNIKPGVHTYDRFAEVTLTATPKPGYQFVYWMGNVTDATTGTTTVFLDSPKMVIAVFERSKFDLVEYEEEPQVSTGGGGLVQSGGASDTSLDQAIYRTRQPKFNQPNGDVPVPEDNGESDPPVPVPEPATVALFCAGLLMLSNYRRKGKNTTEKT